VTPKKVLVIGLGRFGSALVEVLWDHGCEIVAIDKSGEAVEPVRDRTSAAFVADGSDPKVLEGIGARDVDVAVVTYGEDFEASVLAVATLAQIGVKSIVARAATERQAHILKTVGATRAVQVENEMGRRIAPEILNPVSADLMEFAAGFRIMPWEAQGFVLGKTLAQLDLRRKFGLNVIGYWRARPPGEEGASKPRLLPPAPSYEFAPGDMLLLVGEETDVDRFLAKTTA
jgi:trk system potassium uptake protein TrkA